MSERTPALTIFLFAAGIALGVFGKAVLDPGTPPNPYPALEAVSEPATAKELAAIIVSDDARRLAEALEGPLIQKLGEALAPLIDVFEMRFVGAVERRGDILSAYVAEGRSRGGDPAAVGVVLRVREGKVVGVN